MVVSKVSEAVEKMVSRMVDYLVVLTVEWKESLLVGKMASLMVE
jgi:hypothetical protein